MIRIGRCKYDKSGKRIDPTYPGFTPYHSINEEP